MKTLPCLMCISFLVVACSGHDESAVIGGAPPPDGSTVAPDGSSSLDAGLDASDAEDASQGEVDSGGDVVEAPDPVVTVVVSHPREVRGAWIATVSRINWPSSNTATEQQAQMESILDAVQKAGLNTVFFQVRPEADALYESNIEPWSRYLTGTQGVNPGYDPLTFTIEACHRRGLELHAWLNPYRARAGNVGESAPNHVIHQMPQAVVTYGSLRWLDPGHPDAFAHTNSVIEDLLSRYDIDGIHFDDYFYPYPQSGLTFDDDATYAAYGGGMSRGDWRRDNVNRLVEAVGKAVEDLRSDVRWGISPFGIYRPGMPPGVVGLDQYEALYADPLKWMEEGWLEYVAPQLYWPTTSSGQPYKSLLAWWDERAVETGRMLFIGNSASSGYSIDEYRAEMDAIRQAEAGATRGAIWWSVGPIVANTNGLSTMLASEYYGIPAATPALLSATEAPPPYPSILMEEGTLRITSKSDGIRYWAVYRETTVGWEIGKLVPAATTEFTLSQGTWAVSAIDRRGLESLGVVVEGHGEGEGDAGSPEESCVHTYGGVYIHGGCSPSYQCCNGQWLARGTCGACICEEETGLIGCGT